MAHFHSQYYGKSHDILRHSGGNKSSVELLVKEFVDIYEISIVLADADFPLTVLILVIRILIVSAFIVELTVK